MRRQTKYFMYAAGAVLFLVIFFTLALPAILKAVLVSQLTKNLHRTATVESVTFNPFRLSLTVQGLSIREPGSDTVFVSFDLLRVNAEIISVFEGGIDLSEVRLEKPYVHLVRTGASAFNFSDLLTGGGKPPEKEKKPSEPVLFSVANIKITGGNIDFEDKTAHAHHRIDAIELALPLISNFKQYVQAFAQPSFSAIVNGKSLSLVGQTKPFADSLETQADFNLRNLNVAKFLPYAPVKLNFKMPMGRLSLNLALRFIQRSKKAMELKVSGRAALTELEMLSLEDTPLLKLPRLAVSGINCSISRRELSIDNITVQGLNAAISRDKDGSINLQKLVGSDNQTRVQPAPAPQEPAPETAWTVKVNTFIFSGGAVAFNDRQPARPALFTIDNMTMGLAHISTARDGSTDINMNCSINKQAALGLQGTFTIDPLAAQLNLSLADFDITPCQSYIPETLLLSLNGGILSLKGAIDLKQEKGATPAIGWQGDIRLANFAAARAGEKEDLLKFQALDIQSLRAGTSPLALDIQTIRLAGLFMQPVVEADGTVNLASLTAAPAAPQPAPAPAAQKKEPLPPINVGSIVLEKGQIQFIDKSIRPRYATDLADIQGRIANISTKPDAEADINLNAKLNRYAPLKISGTIKPLQEKLNADIKMLFKNIDLSPFSPYSGKFIGRMISKGRLSFDLAYVIKDNQLTAQNKILLDQFTLGKSVQSKDATSLPVGLAISLLKDRKGDIHLDLPISGSLDDPSFSIGKVVLQTLVNLLEKAATSPFALVGALIPGGMDVSSITFTCGSAELSEEATKKLDALAGLLAEKTDLSLEIQADADADLDREGLCREMVMRKIKAMKFNDMSKKERADLTPDKVVIASGEYEDYLWRAYKAEKFEKPTNVLGLSKRLPADEIMKLMAGHMKVDDEDMKDMLQQRGLAVKQYLSETAKVPPERIFIIDPVVATGKGDAGCCVEFKLK